MPETRLTKTKLTTAEAAAQLEHADAEIRRLKPLRDEAAEVLLAYFERTGKRTYRDRVGLTQAPPRTILDQGKVRTFLGDRLREFQKRITPSPSVAVLKLPDVPVAATDQLARSRRSAGAPKKRARGTRGSAGPRARTAEATPSR